MTAQEGRDHGVTLPLPARLHAHGPLLTELADHQYRTVWSLEADGPDAITPLALAAAWEPRLRLGTAIVPVFTRGPAVIAQTAAALADAAPGRVTIGIGSSSNVIVEQWNGLDFVDPYRRVRDVLRFLREALTGERVARNYDTFTVDGFTLRLVPQVPPPLLVAALRPGMLRLAGREADGAILSWLSADDVKTVAPIVHDSAEGGAPAKEIVARIVVCPSSDADMARGLARRSIASYLTVPVYRAFQSWLGRGARLQSMWERWDVGDRSGAANSIPDDVVDELVVHGPADLCRAKLAAYFDAGVTRSSISLVLPPGSDFRSALRELAPG